MKAAAFDYVRPTSLGEVCGYLADDDLDVRIIAGGQSLVPMMAMRLVRPELLVDINEVAALTGIDRDGSDLVIRAATRQAIAERTASVRNDLPLLSMAFPFIGHDQTRNRGTVGGSMAHADPSAEICLVATTLGATAVATDGKTERRIAMDDFFFGPMTTSLEPNECLSAIRFPVWTDTGRIGTGFERSQFARQRFRNRCDGGSTRTGRERHLHPRRARHRQCRTDPASPFRSGGRAGR